MAGRKRSTGRPGVHHSDGKTYMGLVAAARYLGISPSTLDRHRKRHPTALAGHRIYGDTPLYLAEDLDTFRARYLSPRPAEPEAVAI
jgi:hypothetical protein